MMPRPGWLAGWHVGGRRAAGGTLRRYALDERTWEVGQARSSWEAAEQARETGGGGGGAKGLPKGNVASETRRGRRAG
jgi:hypothetical protein